MLKKILLSGVMLFCWCIVANAADTPASNAMENQWFKLTLPAGWEELKIPNAPEVPGVNLMLVNKEKNSFVSIVVFPGMDSAKKAAEDAVKNMRKQKIKVADPIEENGIYRIPVTRGAVKGTAYFGSNGKDGGIVSVFSTDEGAIKELFANFKPVDSAMFPNL